MLKRKSLMGITRLRLPFVCKEAWTGCPGRRSSSHGWQRPTLFAVSKKCAIEGLVWCAFLSIDIRTYHTEAKQKRRGYLQIPRQYWDWR